MRETKEMDNSAQLKINFDSEQNKPEEPMIKAKGESIKIPASLLREITRDSARKLLKRR